MGVCFHVWEGPTGTIFRDRAQGLEAHGQQTGFTAAAPRFVASGGPGGMSRKAMKQAGFVDASVVDWRLKWRAVSRGDPRLHHKSTVRTSMVLERQAARSAR